MSERTKITIDVSQWSRLAEVVGYAEWDHISVYKAIEILVNTGLSHSDYEFGVW